MAKMFEHLVTVLVSAWIVYAVLGLAFAVPFVWFGVERVDSQAKGAGLGFRLLILPGVAAFWPLLLQRGLRGNTESPRASDQLRGMNIR